MQNNEKITHCYECEHCFESRRSKTGYSCEVWGHEDFACDTKLTGFCHKATPANNTIISENTVLFASLEDAESARDKLIEIAYMYGIALVSDLKELAGLNSAYDDSKSGWIGEAVNSDIHRAGSTGLWYIDLPEPTCLD